MTLDRGEVTGTGIALLLHVGLIVALTMNLARVPTPAEPPPVAIEIVDSDEVALRAAASTPVTAPPPPSQAPEIGEAPAVEPLPAPPVVTPTPAPTPPQPLARAAPAPTPRPAPPAPPAPRAQPQPRPSPAPRAAAPARQAPAQRPAPRVSRLGDDFLKGIPDAPSAPRPAAAAPQQAATFSAAAKASVDGAIKRQIQPCADRQPAIGAGAERIRVTLNLRLDRDGRLSRPPSIVRTSGVDEDNARFEDLVTDQAIRVFRECAPLRLPADLYSTPQGGWGNINLVYRVP